MLSCCESTHLVNKNIEKKKKLNTPTDLYLKLKKSRSFKENILSDYSDLGKLIGILLHFF